MSRFIFFTLFFLMGFGIVNAAEDKKTVKFSSDEAKFLASLAEDQELIKPIIVLLGLSEALMPKKSDEVVTYFMKARVSSKFPSVGDTIVNLRKIYLLKTREHVILFNMKKLKWKPSKENAKYFRDLADRMYMETMK